MNYCLIKPLADSFKRALKAGALDPKKLVEMSSEERRSAFADVVGKEHATKINELFEKKMLMKDMEYAMVSWAKQVTGVSSEIRNSLIERIQKMDTRILDPQNEKAFLEDLAKKRLNTEVTFEEAKRITELSKNLSDTKANLRQDPLAYGKARVEMENYLNDIKRENSKMSFQDLKNNPLGTIVRGASNVSGIAKSLKATLDVSALGRQGFKTIFTHPKEWANGAMKTFKETWDTLKSKTSDNTVMDAIKSEIYARENSLNGNYKRMKLDIGTGEEAYPSSVPERIPGIGRVFKASEIAYQGFLTRLRADVADAYVKVAEQEGIDLHDKAQAEAIGRLVNSLTGRGNLGILEGSSKVINNVFFSPKSLKANIDFLTGHQLEGVFSGERSSTSFTRKQAAKNLLKVIVGVATVLSIAKSVNNDSVELDPTSADFGKIKVKDTRFDVAGGMSSILTLANRLLTGKSKSSVTGKISDIGTGMGQQTKGDVLLRFFENKLSPSAALLKDLYTGTDNLGNPITTQGELSNMFTPLPIVNAVELEKNPNSANILLAMIADSLGVATNTYSDTSAVGQTVNKDLIKSVREISNAVGKPIRITNWKTSTAPDILAFKDHVSDSDFLDAMNRYNFQINQSMETALQSVKFKNFSENDKLKYLNQLDEDAKKVVFRQFDFRPPKQAKVQRLRI